VGATTASTLSTWEPVVTVITASLFLGERLSSLGMLGGGLIMVAVLILTVQPLEPHG
ncbi:MAG: EamA family transporter, partial [Prochlorothrix sp.]